MRRGELTARLDELLGRREPFVLATVVRVHRPTSVRPGDSAVVLSDGTIDGFVGGVCATSSVRLHSLRLLATGDALLLRLEPGEPGAGDLAAPLDGVLTDRNPCHSGGSMEIFLEPHLPAARLVVVGDSPIAQALERVASGAGYDCQRVPAGDPPQLDGAAALVVAAHGSGEAPVLAAALAAEVPYVALVASAKRGEVVRSELSDVSEDQRARLRTPAGLAIGAELPGEIAISILAEVVAHQRSAPPAQAVLEATDPVCGMTVAVTASTPRLVLGAETLCFCSEGCRDAYAREHAEAVVAR